MYKVNDYLVYGKDVCKVEAIEEKKFNNETYYLLRPIKNKDLKISAPITDKAKKIRPLISKEEIDLLITKIPLIEPITIEDKFIELEYKRLINSGTHEDLIRIIKTTYLRNKERIEKNKKVAEKDKNYFELAEEYLYHELSITLEKSFEETKDYIVNQVTKLDEN